MRFRPLDQAPLKTEKTLNCLARIKKERFMSPRNSFGKRWDRNVPLTVFAWTCTFSPTRTLMQQPLVPFDTLGIFSQIGCLSALSGGDLYMYPSFDAARDGMKFANDLKYQLSRTFGFDALLRLRVSNGTSKSLFNLTFQVSKLMITLAISL